MKKMGRTKKSESFRLVKNNLKHLTFAELEQIIAFAMRYRKEKLGEEELRLIKEKEELELKLKELKNLDKKENL